MRTILIRSAIALVFLVLVWLLAGRQLSLFLDRLGTLPLSSLPVSPLAHEGSMLILGEMALNTQNDRSSDIHINADSSNRVILSKGAQSFPLGTEVQPSGRELMPDPSDEIKLTIRRSILSWPTPFEMNFMTGHSPSWKRHLYYRLEWKKPSGAKLEMEWRYEQHYYDAWASGMMTREGSTGIIRAEIHD